MVTYNMTHRFKNKRQAVLIILLLFFLIVGLLFFNKAIMLAILYMRKSTNDLIWRSTNLLIMIVYMGCFGVLGYKKSIKNNLNGHFWGIICGLLGVWGYLYLLVFKSNSEQPGRRTGTSA